MTFNLADKKIHTIEDIFNNIDKAKSLYSSGKFEEAYPIIVNAAADFDMFASIGLKGPNIDKAQYKAVYMLAGDICGELAYTPAGSMARSA